MIEKIRPLAYIVEDDDQQADIFTQAMNLAGFITLHSSDGRTAISSLGTNTPAVVILDLYLPGLSGDKVLDYIRNTPHLEKVIVVLTTFDSLLADNLREKCNYLLLKPISFRQLRDLGNSLRAKLPSI